MDGFLQSDGGSGAYYPQITLEGEVAVVKRTAIALVVVLAVTVAWLVPQSIAATSRIKAAGSSSSGFRWEPTSRTISKGDTIVWTNPTSKRHTVTAYGGNWSKSTTIDPGEKTSKRFRSSGTFRFRCLVRGHSAINDGRCVGMCGTVVVR